MLCDVRGGALAALTMPLYIYTHTIGAFSNFCFDSSNSLLSIWQTLIFDSFNRGFLRICFERVQYSSSIVI